jgi:hypothetical protein
MADNDRGMFDDEIRWRLPPVPPLNPIPDYSASTHDLVGMLTADVIALEAHLASVTADLAITRELVQQALDHIVRLTAQLDKSRVRVLDQQRQIRALLELSQ